jgi:nitrite reductase/ring-hydroxylating ferredoxin subunit/alkylhydroperoxidase/carboxymuconolactone decarboxylase family protein YurZ
MSDALDYLLKARPEAMGHYFKFVGSAGKHLDPKTRALISVITKVHAQTEAGFRQYLRRALQADVRPIEILDALLMAFPALGLTKIVWAIDVLLKMDLPEFRLEALTGEPNWHRIGAAESFEFAQTVHVECEGKSVFVHRSAQEYRVFDARCPHRDTLIPESALAGPRLICPRHGWIFDAHDGRCLEGGDTGLIRLPSRIDDGELQASW